MSTLIPKQERTFSGGHRYFLFSTANPSSWKSFLGHQHQHILTLQLQVVVAVGKMTGYM